MVQKNPLYSHFQRYGPGIVERENILNVCGHDPYYGPRSDASEISLEQMNFWKINNLMLGLIMNLPGFIAISTLPDNFMKKTLGQW